MIMGKSKGAHKRSGNKKKRRRQQKPVHFWGQSRTAPINNDFDRFSVRKKTKGKSEKLLKFMKNTSAKAHKHSIPPNEYYSKHVLMPHIDLCSLSLSLVHI